MLWHVQWNTSNPDTSWGEESVHTSEVSLFQGVQLHARTVHWVIGENILIGEMASFQGYL